MIKNPNFKDNVILKIGSYAQLMNTPDHGGLDLNECGIIVYPDGKYQFVYRMGKDKLERIGEAEGSSSLDTRTILETISNNLYSFPNKLTLDSIDDGLILLSSPVTPLEFVNLFKDSYTLNKKMSFTDIDFQFLNTYEAVKAVDDDGNLGSDPVILGVDGDNIKLNPTREMYLTGININDIEPATRTVLADKIDKLKKSSPGLIKDFYSDIVILDTRSNLWNRVGYIIPTEHKGAEIILVNDLTPLITFNFDNYDGMNVVFESTGVKNVNLGNDNVVDEHGKPLTELKPKSRYNIIYDTVKDVFIVKNIIPALATENNPGLFYLTSLDFLMNGDHLSRFEKPYAVKFSDFKEYLISIYSKLEDDLNTDNSLNNLLNISNIPDDKDLLSFQRGNFHYITKEDLISRVNINTSIAGFLDLDGKFKMTMSPLYMGTAMWKMDIAINSNDEAAYIAFKSNTNNAETIYKGTTKLIDNSSDEGLIYIPINAYTRNVIILNKTDYAYHLKDNKDLVLQSPIDFSSLGGLEFHMFDESLTEIAFKSTDEIILTTIEPDDISNINTLPVVTDHGSSKPDPLIEINYGTYDDSHNNFNNNAYTKMYLDSDDILAMHYSKLIQKPIFMTCMYNSSLNFEYQMNILKNGHLYARSIYDVMYDKATNTQNTIDASIQLGSSANADEKTNCNTFIALEDIKKSNNEACFTSKELNNFLNLDKTNFENIVMSPNDEGICIKDKTTGNMIVVYYDKLINAISIDSFDTNIEETDGDKKFQSTTEFNGVGLSNSLSRYQWNIGFTITGLSKDNENVIVINNVLFIKDKDKTIKYMKLDASKTVDLSKSTLDEIPNTEYSVLMTDYNNIIVINDNLIYVYKIVNYKPEEFINLVNPVGSRYDIKDIVYNKTLFILTDSTYYIGDVKYNVYDYVNRDNLYYLYLDLFGALNWIDIINPKDSLITFDINLVAFQDKRQLTTVDLYDGKSFPDLIKGDYSSDEFYNGGYLFKKCRYMVYDSKDPKKLLLLVGDINYKYIILELDPDDGHFIGEVTADYIFRKISDPLIFKRIPALDSFTLPVNDIKGDNYSLLIKKTDWDDQLGLVNLAYIHNTTLVGNNTNIILYSVHTANTETALSETNASLRKAEIETILREQFYVCDKTFIRLNVETTPIVKEINFVNPFPDYVPYSWSASDLSYLQMDGKVEILNDDYTSIMTGTLIKNTPVEIDTTKSAFGNNRTFEIKQSNSNYITMINNSDTMRYSYENEDEILQPGEIDIVNFKKNKVILKNVNNLFVINIDGYDFDVGTTGIMTTDIVIDKLFIDEVNDEISWFITSITTNSIIKYTYNMLTNEHTEDKYSISDIDKIINIVYYNDNVITVIYQNDSDNIKIFDIDLTNIDLTHLALSDNINVRKYSTLVIRDNLYLITDFISDKALDIMYNISTIKKTNDYYKIDYVSDLNEIRLNNLLNIDNINIIPDEYKGCYVSILNDKLILRLKDRSYIDIISKFHFNKNYKTIKSYEVITTDSKSDRTLIALSGKELYTNLILSDNTVNTLISVDDYNACMYIDLNMGNIFYIDTGILLPKKYKLIIYNYNNTVPTIIIHDKTVISDTVVLDSNDIEYNVDINFITHITTKELTENLVNVSSNMISIDDKRINYTIDITDNKFSIADDGYMYVLSNTDVKKIKVSEYAKGDYIDVYDVTKPVASDIIIGGYVISNLNDDKIIVQYNNVVIDKINIGISNILYGMRYDDYFLFITSNGIYKNDELIIKQNVEKFNVDLDDKVIYIKDGDKYHTYDYRLNIMI